MGSAPYAILKNARDRDLLGFFIRVSVGVASCLLWWESMGPCKDKKSWGTYEMVCSGGNIKGLGVGGNQFRSKSVVCFIDIPGEGEKDRGIGEGI